MSYILDALKKAERQRDIGQVPGIGSEHQGASRVGGGRWIYALLAVLLVNAALLVYALWPARVSPTRPVAASPDGGQALPAATPVGKSPAVAPPTAAPPSPVVPPVSTRRPAPAPAPVPLRSLPPLPEPVNKVLVESPGIADNGAGGSAVPDRAVSAPAPEETAGGVHDNLPVWPQVSGQLFREINGGLRLDVHVYSKQPQERFVLVNMQKYNEGERLQEGPVVDEITPEGVILSFRGQRFRVQAQ